MVDMYRKSIDFYTMLGGDGFSSFTEQPGDHGKKKKKTAFAWKAGMPFQTYKTDITNEDIGRFEHSGRFRWEAHQMRGSSDVKLGGEYWEIAPLTGSMQVGKYDDSPTNMMNTPSQFSAKDNWAYSYGFYDSGAGFGELTNHDQSYVYITPDVSSWMGDLTRRDAKYGAAPFRTFVLPGSHDAGMYDMSAVDKIAHNSAFLGFIFGLAGFATAKLAEPFAKEIAQNFAMTQKDQAARQLDMGARYFDFRPGTCAPGIPLGGIFHQHGPIPGVVYDHFLRETFNWLMAHPTEIAVVCVGFAGFSADSMKPSYATLDETLKGAQRAVNGAPVKIGDRGDLQASYNDLIGSGKRLIVLYGPDTDAPQALKAKKYDSYSPEVYETTKSSNIIGALNRMSKSGQAGYDYTVLQLQGTASSVGKAGTVFNASKSGSPLMSTKAAFDSVTYPWVVANARKNLGDGQLIVLLNDFVDNALTLHALKTMAPGLY
ncbi:MAG: hypothetical protein ACREHE_03190 [Rhizomicrobium sp.]